MLPHLPPEETSVQDTAAAHARGQIHLIDCREPDEHALCHIHRAKLIPLSTWNQEFPRGFPEKDAAIVIHCHHGMRSLRATRFLRQQGFTNVQSMAGGIEAWSLEIDGNVPRY